MISQGFTPKEKQKLSIAEGIAKSYFPYLGGIFSKLDIRFDKRIETAAVTGSGKLLFNREFFHRLAPGVETAFILAHELLHLAQLIFERGKAFSDQDALNIAHDLLINELLCDTMGIDVPPCDGLDWKKYREDLQSCSSQTLPSKASVFSLEEMVRHIIDLKEDDYHTFSAQSWNQPPPLEEREGKTVPRGNIFANRPFAGLFGEEEDEEEKEEEKAPSPAPDPAENEPETAEDDPVITQEKDEAEGQQISISLDLIGTEMENKLFPEEKDEEREKRCAELREICRSSAAANAVFSAFSSHSSGPDSAPNSLSQAVNIVRSSYVPPWQMAMQRWFDGVAVSQRSWARASRRGAFRSDVVLPGRSQERFLIHIILDTSGSMSFVIPYLLGQISIFARNVGLEQAHILQCDTAVTRDELVDIDRLEKYQVSGYGGSDMSPAMLKLAEDPDVTSVLVITDGFIGYPVEKDIPYNVLWCVPEQDFGRQFPYGKVIHVPIPIEGE